MMDDNETAGAMRRLKGQFATPSWMKIEARELEQRGLMKFHEWPSGHWSITERGYDFLGSLSDR